MVIKKYYGGESEGYVKDSPGGAGDVIKSGKGYKRAETDKEAKGAFVQRRRDRKDARNLRKASFEGRQITGEGKEGFEQRYATRRADYSHELVGTKTDPIAERTKSGVTMDPADKKGQFIKNPTQKRKYFNNTYTEGD